MTNKPESHALPMDFISPTGEIHYIPISVLIAVGLVVIALLLIALYRNWYD